MFLNGGATLPLSFGPVTTNTTTTNDENSVLRQRSDFKSTPLLKKISFSASSKNENNGAASKTPQCRADLKLSNMTTTPSSRRRRALGDISNAKEGGGGSRGSLKLKPSENKNKRGSLLIKKNGRGRGQAPKSKNVDGTFGGLHGAALPKRATAAPFREKTTTVPVVSFAPLPLSSSPSEDDTELDGIVGVKTRLGVTNRHACPDVDLHRTTCTLEDPRLPLSGTGSRGREFVELSCHCQIAVEKQWGEDLAKMDELAEDSMRHKGRRSRNELDEAEEELFGIIDRKWAWENEISSSGLRENRIWDDWDNL